MQTKHVIISVYVDGKTVMKSKEVIITRVRIMLPSRGIGMDFNQKGLYMARELTMIMIFGSFSFLHLTSKDESFSTHSFSGLLYSYMCMTSPNLSPISESYM